jgi:hypothetical protein
MIIIWICAIVWRGLSLDTFGENACGGTVFLSPIGDSSLAGIHYLSPTYTLRSPGMIIFLSPNGDKSPKKKHCPRERTDDHGSFNQRRI